MAGVSQDRPQSRPWLTDLLGIVLLAALATLPFLTPAADLALQRLFYTPGAAHPWGAENAPLWRWFYRFGPWPALVTALASFGVLIAGRWRPDLRRWRVHALYLLLSLALGPGLLVNVVFKDHWGRPRPRQVTELGGTWPYQTFVEKGVGGRGKSFPCGHSSMGFYFVSFYFLLRRRHKALAVASLVGAGAYGTLIGAARMAAGGHFASDVAWSAVMPAAAAWMVYYGVMRVPQAEDRAAAGMPPAPVPRWLLVLLPFCAAFAVAMGILGTPAYSEFSGTIPATSPVRLALDVSRCDVEIVLTEDPGMSIALSGDAQGFGWPGSKVLCQPRFELQDRHPAATIRVAPSGWFNELNGRLVVTIPARAARSMSGRVRGGDVVFKAPGPEWLPQAVDLDVEGQVDMPASLRPQLTTGPESGRTRVLSRRP